MPPAAERFKTTYQPGQVIFSEGEPGNDLYILLSGCVEVSRDGVQLAVVDKPKSFLGAVSILLGQPRTATVVAQSVCTIFRVPDSDRDDFWKSRPELTLQLARTLARRLSEMNENCVGLMRGELDLQEPQAEPAALSAASAAASAVGENMAEAEEVADGEPSLDSEHMAAAESAPVEPAAGDAPGPYGDDEEEEDDEEEVELDSAPEEDSLTVDPATVPPISEELRALISRRLDLRLQLEGLTQYRRGLQASVEADSGCTRAIRQQEVLLRGGHAIEKLEERLAELEQERSEASGQLQEVLDIGVKQIRLLIWQTQLEPQLIAEGSKLAEDEPLADILRGHGIEARTMFSLAAYQILLEERQVVTVAEAQTVREDFDPEVEGEEEAAWAVADFLLVRRDLMGREGAALEKQLMGLFWDVYRQVAVKLVAGEFESKEQPPVRAFLRWGLLGSGPRWLSPEYSARLLVKCRQPRRVCSQSMADTYILHADEYLEWVAQGFIAPCANDDLELNHRESDRWHADRAVRRVIHSRWMSAAYGELRQRNRMHLDELTRTLNRDEKRLGAIQGKSEAERQQKKTLREEVRNSKVEIGRVGRLIKRIDEDWLAKVDEALVSWEEKLAETGVVSDPVQVVSQETDFIRRVCRLTAKLQEHFLPRMLRVHFRPDTGRVLDRGVLLSAVMDAEKRDPLLMQQLLQASAKRERRVYLRHSPVFLIVPALGTLGYAANPRKGTEFGRLILPGMLPRSDAAREVFWNLLADFRYDTSRGEAGVDVLKADTLASAYSQIRWTYRRRSPDVRKKAMINMDEKERVNWRRHYRLYMRSALEGGNRLFHKCPEVYQMLLEYIELPEGVERVRKL